MYPHPDPHQNVMDLQHCLALCPFDGCCLLPAVAVGNGGCLLALAVCWRWLFDGGAGCLLTAVTVCWRQWLFVGGGGCLLAAMDFC